MGNIEIHSDEGIIYGACDSYDGGFELTSEDTKVIFLDLYKHFLSLGDKFWECLEHPEDKLLIADAVKKGRETKANG